MMEQNTGSVPKPTLSKLPVTENSDKPMTSLTIWTNARLTEQGRGVLAGATQSHRLTFDEPPSEPTAGTRRQAQEADIVFGQPDPKDLIASAKLRWVHISTAGYSQYDSPDLRAALAARNIPLTKSSAVFCEPCAQHVMACLLAEARQLCQAYDQQLNNRSWQQLELRNGCQLLENQTILIVGFGTIGSRLVELLAPYPVRVLGFRRSRGPESAVPVISPDQLPEALSTADHVINILPESASTLQFFNKARFSQMRPGSRYYSIGRGTTTDQDALIEALRSAGLAAAYLDVTDPEPLPADHRLWSMPNCYITPHIAGGHANESVRLVRHFLDNLERFEQGIPLVDRVQ
jgi:phosphoglycerate dehydrogenase-like enzyme